MKPSKGGVVDGSDEASEVVVRGDGVMKVKPWVGVVSGFGKGMCWRRENDDTVGRERR